MPKTSDTAMVLEQLLDDLSSNAEYSTITVEYGTRLAEIASRVSEKCLALLVSAKRREKGTIQKAAAIWTAYQGLINSGMPEAAARESATAIGATLGLDTPQVLALIENERNARKDARENSKTRATKIFSVLLDGEEITKSARSNGEVARALNRAGIPIGTAAKDAIDGGLDASVLAVNESVAASVGGHGVTVQRIA